MQSESICIQCDHYTGDGSCKAFKNIPSLFLIEGDKHNKKTEDQKNEIVFKPL